MTLTINEVLHNRYRIISEIKAGGFGAVYCAEDYNLKRNCAVKENRETDPAAQQQFINEARMLANLNHPNLPRVTDYFVIPGRGQYLVMDLVDGTDLEEMVNQGGRPLQINQAVYWIGQVCDALTHLHSQAPAIIHRDIKPGNIRITPKGQAMLVDFGIAKTFNPGSKTDPGARGVSPGYSPWEQYGHGQTDARTDIYALGATLYAVLTMAVPAESIQRMQGLSLTPPMQLNPTIPSNIAGVLLQSMELKPEHRFQSAVDFKTALNNPSFRYTPGVMPAISTVVLPSQGMGNPAGGSLPPTVVIATGAGSHQAGGIGSVSRSTFRPVNWNKVLMIAAIVLGIVALGVLGVVLGTNLIHPADNTAEPSENVVVELTETSPVRYTLPPTLAPTEVPPTLAPTATLPMRSATALPYRSGETRVLPVDGGTMVFVPAGEFLMGAAPDDAYAEPDEKPQHTVYLDGFWIDRTEVTNAMFQKFVTATNHKTDVELSGRPFKWDIILHKETTSKKDINTGISWKCPRGTGKCQLVPEEPVVYVSWNDAREYCEWAGERLPTEAEWEKAARGENGRIYPWGDEVGSSGEMNVADSKRCNMDSDTCSWANMSIDDGEYGASAVGSYPDGRSPYGVLDMAGNVWEWVADTYNMYFYANSEATQDNPFNSGSQPHVLRGGSYYSAYTEARTSNRYGEFPQDVIDAPVGFRCAMDGDKVSAVQPAVSVQSGIRSMMPILTVQLALVGGISLLPVIKKNNWGG